LSRRSSVPRLSLSFGILAARTCCEVSHNHEARFLRIENLEQVLVKTRNKDRDRDGGEGHDRQVS
jgi:hypothetical protein